MNDPIKALFFFSRDQLRLARHTYHGVATVSLRERYATSRALDDIVVTVATQINLACLTDMRCTFVAEAGGHSATRGPESLGRIYKTVNASWHAEQGLL